MCGDDFIKSSLRLFLSVDIVGSTAFKQGQFLANKSESASGGLNPPAEPWFPPIMQFYREIERTFYKEWRSYGQQISKKMGWPIQEVPEFWKAAGDELIYTKELNNHREALICLHVWIRSINLYRATFKKNYTGLDLKSTAWLAGFPVRNSEVFFRSSASDYSELFDDDDPIYANLCLLRAYYEPDHDKAIVRDFIGPSMDTGFRLSALATPRKLIVSIDLALLLARTQSLEPSYKDLQLHYEGRQTLKGVLGGAPYPIFWIDMAPADEINVVEDGITNNKAVSVEQMRKFCDIFIRENENFLIRPYMINDEDEFFREKPDHHEVRIDHIRKYWESERGKRETEKIVDDNLDENHEIAAPIIGHDEFDLIKFTEQLKFSIEKLRKDLK